MIESLFNTTTIPVLEQVLGFAEARHQVLAGNIANLDVPDYQVRDLSVERFQEMLRDALAEPPKQAFHSQGLSGAPSATGSTSALLQRDQRLREVGETLPSILRHDGNNVGMEEQVREMSKNQMLHSLAVSIMNSQFRLLQTAINERV